MSPRLLRHPQIGRETSVASRSRFLDEQGLATLIALVALGLFSIIALYMSFNATTQICISDNYEGQIQAMAAAKAGLNHAREAFRGIPNDDLLMGPNGVGNTGLTTARKASFRNPLSWTLARSLNVLDPTSDLAGINDDGVLSTGKYGTTNGVSIVPLTGIGFTAPNPYGSGNITTARYFVKVADNNGEASETTADGADNPFHDGDGIIVIRSMGVAATIRETAGGEVRRNSVAVVESRFRTRHTWELDAPFVVEGNNVLPSGPNMYNGNSFNINGGANNYGIATIDTNPTDGTHPTDIMKAPLAKNQANNITGLGSTPSIADITSTLTAGTDKALLKDPAYLWDLVNNVLPSVADNYYTTDQHWSAPINFDFGNVDMAKPMNDPSQRPKITVVKGNCQISGDITGGGIFVCTGKLSGNGHFLFNGIMIVIGQGEVDLGGWNLGLNGGMFVCQVTHSGGTYTFGTPKVTLAGNSNITINSNSLGLGSRLMPSEQLGWREITSETDPP